MDGQPKLLVVDDNVGQRMALAAILADLDVGVVEAPSGREALRCLLQQEFAVILLDVNMPGLDGFETAALIRQRRSSEHTPIIFVTADSDDAHAARGYSLGAVDYILAPVEPNVLRTKVAVFLDVYRKTEQLTRQREDLRRYAAQLQQLSQASLAINSAQSVEEVLQVVADGAAEIVGAHQSSVSAVLQSDKNIFTATRASDKYGGRRDFSRGPCSVLPIGIQQPARMTVAELEANRASVLAPPELLGGVAMRGWLAAPMNGRDGSLVGMAQLSEKVGGDFTAEDEGLLSQLAQMASVTIDNILSTEAQQANRLKDEFLSVLSHELRTPLQAMLTWISILRTEAVDPGMAARGLDVIERSARAQSQLIDDLLDVSRIIRGQLRLETAVLELPDVIAQAIEALKPAAAAKDIHITWSPPTSACRVTGDASRLQQVVWNLLSNAVKFTPEGGRVAIGLTQAAGQFTIQVRDTGSGIPAAFLPHVFEQFRQADSTTVRQHGGLGLGLAIVRHLVELHGGSVHADNIPEGGAVFTILLPCADHVTLGQSWPMPALPGAEVRRSRATASANGGRLDGIRVVLVEDDPDARECLTEVLQLLGAQVIAVGAAAAALAVVEETRPDVLLSDIGMPDEDGYALIRQIRAREAGRGDRLPAAALTAYVRTEDRANALTAGFDAHVPKPVQPLDLAAVVKRLAGRPTAL